MCRPTRLRFEAGEIVLCAGAVLNGGIERLPLVQVVTRSRLVVLSHMTKENYRSQVVTPRRGSALVSEPGAPWGTNRSMFANATANHPRRVRAACNVSRAPPPRPARHIPRTPAPLPRIAPRSPDSLAATPSARHERQQAVGRISCFFVITKGNVRCGCWGLRLLFGPFGEGYSGTSAR